MIFLAGRCLVKVYTYIGCNQSIFRTYRIYRIVWNQYSFLFKARRISLWTKDCKSSCLRVPSEFSSLLQRNPWLSLCWRRWRQKKVLWFFLRFFKKDKKELGKRSSPLNQTFLLSPLNAFFLLTLAFLCFFGCLEG